MAKWTVTVGASKTGSIGTLYHVKRTYEIESTPDLSPTDAAIARAYQDGDIEHVRVESIKQIPDATNGLSKS